MCTAVRILRNMVFRALKVPYSTDSGIEFGRQQTVKPEVKLFLAHYYSPLH